MKLTASPLTAKKSPIWWSLSCMIAGMNPSLVGPPFTSKLPPLDTVAATVLSNSYVQSSKEELTRFLMKLKEK